MQPKTKVSELVDRINSYTKSKERDEFSRTAILRDIEALQNADPATASAFRGLMAALERDEQATKKHFEIARRLRPGDPRIEFNYSQALHNLRYFAEARKFAKKAHEVDPGDLVLLDNLIDHTMFSYRALEAAQLIERRRRLSSKSEHPDVGRIEIFSEFYRKHKLRDDDVETVLTLSLDLLREAGLFADKEESGLRHDGESEWISGRLEVAAPVETIVELNMQLADMQAASEFSPDLMTLVNFMFVPASN